MASKVFRKLQVFSKTPDFKAATKLVEIPLVEPSEKQLRIRNVYAGVNATDVNITSARYFTDGKVPFDIGLEAVGVIDAIGSSVQGFKIGQPVLVSMNCSGFSEYQYNEAKDLISLPDLKPNYLVAFINGLTASIGLDQAGRIKEGDKVLITAAAGGTGQIAVQWAKQRGCYVIGMTSSAAKAEYLKSLGADCIINYREENLDEVLTEKFPAGIDVVWETIGGEVYETLFHHLAPRGRLVIIGSITSYLGEGMLGHPITALEPKLLMGSKSLSGFLLTDYTSQYREYLGKLIPMIQSGKLQARVDMGENSEGGKFVGIDQVVRAEEHLHGRKNVGKVVVQISEP